MTFAIFKGASSSKNYAFSVEPVNVPLLNDKLLYPIVVNPIQYVQTIFKGRVRNDSALMPHPNQNQLQFFRDLKICS